MLIWDDKKEQYEEISAKELERRNMFLETFEEILSELSDNDEIGLAIWKALVEERFDNLIVMRG